MGNVHIIYRNVSIAQLQFAKSVQVRAGLKTDAESGRLSCMENIDDRVHGMHNPRCLRIHLIRSLPFVTVNSLTPFLNMVGEAGIRIPNTAAEQAPS
jgi:hypothetical protein